MTWQFSFVLYLTLLLRFSRQPFLFPSTETCHKHLPLPDFIHVVESAWKGVSGDSLVLYKSSLLANSRSCF